MTMWTKRKLIAEPKHFDVLLKRFSAVEKALVFRKTFVAEFIEDDEHIFSNTVLDRDDDLNKDFDFLPDTRTFVCDLYRVKHLVLDDIFSIAEVFKFSSVHCPNPKNAISRMKDLLMSFSNNSTLRMNSVQQGLLSFENVDVSRKLSKEQIESAMQMNLELFNPKRERNNGPGSREWRNTINRYYKDQAFCFGGLFYGL